MSCTEKFKAQLIANFTDVDELQKMELSLQEMILYCTGNKPESGLSDFEREELIENLCVSTRLLKKIRRVLL